VNDGGNVNAGGVWKSPRSLMLPLFAPGDDSWRRLARVTLSDPGIDVLVVEEVLVVELVDVLLDDDVLVDVVLDVDVLLEVVLDVLVDELVEDELLVVVEVLVVVLVVGQVQSKLQVRKAPAGEPGGQLVLPGGSHSSPRSSTPLPQASVLEVVVLEELEVDVEDEVVVDVEVVVVVVVLVVVVVGQGAAAGAPRNRLPSTFVDAVSHPPVFGPVTQPHQFCLASMVSAPVYVAPALLPTMLLKCAVFVEMVPAACVALKKMPALVPRLTRPLAVKQLLVIVVFWAPRSAAAEPKLVKVRPWRPLNSKLLLVIDEFWMPPCRPSNRLLLKTLSLIVPKPNAREPRLAPVTSLSKTLPWMSGARLALTPTLWFPSTKKPVPPPLPTLPLRMQLLVKWKPLKLSVSRWKSSPAAV
jgi:hypothetical protein